MVYLDIEELLHFYAEVSDDIDELYHKIKECNYAQLMLLSKKEQITTVHKSNSELNDVNAALNRLKFEKDMWERKLRNLDARLALFNSDIPWKRITNISY